MWRRKKALLFGGAALFAVRLLAFFVFFEVLEDFVELFFVLMDGEEFFAIDVGGFGEDGFALFKGGDNGVFGAFPIALIVVFCFFEVFAEDLDAALTAGGELGAGLVEFFGTFFFGGGEVILWSALGEEITTLREKREHVSKLPGVKIPEPIDITIDLERSLRDTDVAILAVPSPYTRSTCKRMAPFVKNGQKIVNVAKGVEEKTLLTLSEIIEQELPQANVSVLSGPSHAEEVGKGLPTTCVVSSHQRETAEYLQGIFMSPVFRVYTTPDMLGVELGAALKNVIALAAGTADGLGYGDNTKAALITRGIAEISRLGVKMGARMETFYGLSGIGDLIVTCASVHSRNRKAGYLMGKGYTMEQAMAEVKMIVEGVYSAKAAKELAEKYDVEMPIITEINKVLFEGKSAAEAVIDLMVRDKKVETPMLPWEDGQ